MYDVEKYIAQCVRSLLSQSYSTIEVVLVDDGSPDRSAAIAEEVAAGDERVLVIRQRNQGVSIARNAGLEASRGDFVCFVDGDDWLAPTFVENLVHAAKAYDADFVISTRVLGGRRFRRHAKPNVALWNSERTTAELLYPRLPIGAWNKLYRRSFLDDHGIRFESRFAMGEGLAFITDVSQRASVIVATDWAGYWYRRDNVSSVTSTRSVAKMANALEAIDRIECQLVLDSADVRLALEFQRWMTCFEGALVASTEQSAVGIEFYSRCMQVVKRRPLTMAFLTRLTLRLRVKALAVGLSPRLAIWALHRTRGIRQRPSPTQ